MLFSVGHRVVHAERYAPHELAGRGVHRHQAGPRWTEAGEWSERSSVRITCFGAERATALMHVRKFRVLRLLVVSRIRRDPAGRRLVLRVHEDVSELGIGGGAAPVHAAGHAGKGQRRWTTVGPVVPRRVRTVVAELHLVP